MPVLATSEAMIARAGVLELPEYSDLIPVTDVPGFAVRRAYPPGSDLARVVNRQGEQLIKAIIQFMVEPPTAPNGVSSVMLRAWVFPRSKARQLFRGLDELPPDDPDAPTPDSLQRWRRARKPIQVDFVGDFIYDVAADQFLDADGRDVTPASMLDYIYEAHCRTLRTRFVWKWNATSFVRWVARRVVWSLQNACMWLLLRCYDVQLAQPREKLSPFHRFRLSDFKRSAEVEGKGDTFFGFQSSRKNLNTNLVVLAVACVVLYRYGSGGGLLSAAYGNNALTTLALVLGFFAADLLIPLLLKAIIIGLSQIREAVMFFTINVNP